MKAKFCYSEEDFKRISKEMNGLYEANQELQRENKRLKNDLKLSQSREQDYLSVLKNTTEFSKMAITSIDQVRKETTQEAMHKTVKSFASNDLKIPKLNIDKLKNASIQQQPVLSSEHDRFNIHKKESHLTTVQESE